MKTKLPEPRTFADVLNVVVNPHHDFLWRGVIRAFGHALESEFQMLAAICDACQSPIEKYFVAGLYEAAKGRHVALMIQGAELAPGNAPAIELGIQTPIGPFFADFTLTDDNGLKLVIECDGAEWHKDKVRDGNRDKYMQGLGWKIRRFSGSDLFNKPSDCGNWALNEAAS